MYRRLAEHLGGHQRTPAPGGYQYVKKASGIHWDIVYRKRKSEAQYVSIAMEAKEYGIPVPLNDRILEMIGGNRGRQTPARLAQHHRTHRGCRTTWAFPTARHGNSECPCKQKGALVKSNETALWEHLSEMLEEKLSSFPGLAGLCLRDLTSGEEIRIHADLVVTVRLDHQDAYPGSLAGAE